MNRRQLLDHYFLDARARLVDIAAFLDRVERAQGESDFRIPAIMKALNELHEAGANRAERVLCSLSDPTTEPVPSASTKSACGAWPGATKQ